MLPWTFTQSHIFGNGYCFISFSCDTICQVVLKTCPRLQGRNVCLLKWRQQLVLINSSTFMRLIGENKHSYNAREDVKPACTTAGLTRRKAHARDCGMHLGKSNCFNVKCNTQDEMQPSVLQKKAASTGRLWKTCSISTFSITLMSVLSPYQIKTQTKNNNNKKAKI